MSCALACEDNPCGAGIRLFLSASLTLRSKSRGQTPPTCWAGLAYQCRHRLIHSSLGLALPLPHLAQARASPMPDTAGAVTAAQDVALCCFYASHLKLFFCEHVSSRHFCSFHASVLSVSHHGAIALCAVMLAAATASMTRHLVLQIKVGRARSGATKH